MTGSGDIAPDVAGGAPYDGISVSQTSDGHVRRADRGDRGRGHVHHRRVPARPDPHHPRRQPPARPRAGGQGHRARGRSPSWSAWSPLPARCSSASAPSARRGAYVYPVTCADRGAGRGRHRRAARRRRRARPGPRHHPAPRRRGGRGRHRGDRAALPPRRGPQVLPVGAAEWLLRLTPAAAFAVQQAYPRVPAGHRHLHGHVPATTRWSPWAGFAVLCGYAAVALGLAACLLRRRDA